jgi:hypothetical protein
MTDSYGFPWEFTSIQDFQGTIWIGAGTTVKGPESPESAGRGYGEYRIDPLRFF